MEEKTNTKSQAYSSQKPVPSSCSGMQGKRLYFFCTSHPSMLFIAHMNGSQLPKYLLKPRAVSLLLPLSRELCHLFPAETTSSIPLLAQRLELPAPLWLLFIWQPIPLVLMCSYRTVRKAQVLAFPILSHWGWDIVNGPHSEPARKSKHRGN